jgi:hypothetical protein
VVQLTPTAAPTIFPTNLPTARSADATRFDARKAALRRACVRHVNRKWIEYDVCTQPDAYSDAAPDPCAVGHANRALGLANFRTIARTIGIHSAPHLSPAIGKLCSAHVSAK